MLKGLYLCGEFFNVARLKVWGSSINKDLRELTSRHILYGENVLKRQQLFAERKCGVIARRLMGNYVSVKAGDKDLLWSLRIMSDCVETHFTGFALQKKSPYTK